MTMQRMRKQLLVATAMSWLMVALIGCAKAQASYYPLEEGKTWKYQMWISGASANMTVTNLAPRQLYGQKVTPQRIDLAAPGRVPLTLFNYIAEDASGVYVIAQQSASGVETRSRYRTYIIKKPFQVGTSWQTGSSPKPGVSGSATGTIEAIDEVVDTAAGSFRHCTRVRTTGPGGRTSDKWYAPSVGQVKEVDADGTSGQLESYTK